MGTSRPLVVSFLRGSSMCSPGRLLTFDRDHLHRYSHNGPAPRTVSHKNSAGIVREIAQVRAFGFAGFTHGHVGMIAAFGLFTLFKQPFTFPRIEVADVSWHEFFWGSPTALVNRKALAFFISGED